MTTIVELLESKSPSHSPPLKIVSLFQIGQKEPALAQVSCALKHLYDNCRQKNGNIPMQYDLCPPNSPMCG